MKVSQLIQRLQNMNPDSRVVVRGYEEGVNDVLRLARVKVKLNSNTEHYYGQHRLVSDGGVEVIELQGHNKLAPKD